VVGGVVGILGTTLIGERLFTVGIIHGRALLCAHVKLGDGVASWKDIFRSIIGYREY
jgi:hypothetical protein